MVFVETDSFRDLRRLPTDAFRSIPRLPREDVVLPVAASDLVAWYPFRQGTGEDITAGDSNFGDTTDYSASVNGATFQPNGGVTDIQTGANSGAFEFDGVDDTLDLGTVADSDQSLTIMTWVQLSASNSENSRILTKADGNNAMKSGTIFLFLDGGTDIPAFQIRESGGNLQETTDTSALSVGVFAHLAGRITTQSNEITLFRNGQPVGSDTFGSINPLSTQPWRVGEDNPSGSDFLPGTVDGTRIYTTALSDSQINQIYLNTKP